jgi:N-acetylglutamate synthase-like GNAT family acetyltransferase
MIFDIIEYQDQFQSAFKALNAEWLVEYNLMEPHDLEILDNPRKNILDGGGIIYLIQHNNEIIGSAAIINEGGETFELAKMAVAKAYRQKGISKLLLEKCLDKARELKAVRVILFSNHQLKSALGLYEKYGFRYIAIKDSPFITADIKMELLL